MYMVGTGTKFGEIWTENERWKEVMLPGAGYPGYRAGCPGSRSEEERDEHRVGRLNSGEIRRNLWMEIGGKRMGS